MCWKIFLLINSKEKSPKLMGTVAIIICSHLASQIGCVAQWRRRPQNDIMWWTEMHSWEQTNALFMFELTAENCWHVLSRLDWRPATFWNFIFYFLCLEQVCTCFKCPSAFSLRCFWWMEMRPCEFHTADDTCFDVCEKAKQCRAADGIYMWHRLA